LSEGLSLKTADAEIKLLTRLRCESITPFDLPVVPEV